MMHDFKGFSVERIVTGKWKENCYLLTDRDSGEIAIIDPGDDIDLIRPKVTTPGTRVRHILITHGHHDHVGAASGLSEATGIPCSIHQDDLALLRRAPLYALALENKQIIAPKNLAPFADGQVFQLGDSQLEAWSTPGHTAGSVCFHISGCVFTGDTLFKGTMGRTDLPGGNSGQLDQSVDLLVSRLSDEAVILPGHGPDWNWEAASAWWKARIRQAEDQIEEMKAETTL